MLAWIRMNRDRIVDENWLSPITNALASLLVWWTGRSMWWSGFLGGLAFVLLIDCIRRHRKL